MTPNLSLKEYTDRILSKDAIPKKKLIVVLISALSVVLLLLIIMLVNTVRKTNIAPQITTSTKPEESNINLKKEYENPFSTRIQYTNPFSDYKNPFDNLTQ